MKKRFDDEYDYDYYDNYDDTDKQNKNKKKKDKKDKKIRKVKDFDEPFDDIRMVDEDINDNSFP